MLLIQLRLIVDKGIAEDQSCHQAGIPGSIQSACRGPVTERPDYLPVSFRESGVDILNGSMYGRSRACSSNETAFTVSQAFIIEPENINSALTEKPRQLHIEPVASISRLGSSVYHDDGIPAGALPVRNMQDSV